MRHALLTASLAICCIAEPAAAGEPEPVPAAEPEWAAQIRRKLRKKVNFEFVQAPVSEAINFLQQTSDVNMVIDPAARKQAERPITLKMTQASLALALGWILKLSGLDYELRANAVFISTPEKLKPAVVLAVYDIRDLTAAVEDRPGPELDLSGRETDRPAVVPVPGVHGGPAVQALHLVELVKRSIRPQSWNPNLGTSIEERAGELVVVQRVEVHRAISALLSDLRAGRLIQVEVSARFYAADPAKAGREKKAGRLLAEVSTSGMNGQRVHAQRGRTWPANERRDAAFTGALLDVRPVLSADRRYVTLEAWLTLWLPAGPKDDPARGVRVFRAPVTAALEAGKPLSIPLGALPGADGRPQAVAAVLNARIRPPAKGIELAGRMEEAVWKRRIRAALQKKVNLEFTEQPLEDCINYIRGLTDINVIVDPRAFRAGGVDPKAPITLRLRNTDLGLALKWILRMARLDCDLRKGALFISTVDRFGGPEETRWMSYDVRDLARASAQVRGPVIDSQGRLKGAVPPKAPLEPRTAEDVAEILADLIKRTIRPASWGAGNAAIAAQNGRLLVSQVPEAHAQIMRLLQIWRSSSRPEVRLDVSLYALDAGAQAGSVAQVEKSGKLLSRLATVSLNQQRLYAAGGRAWPAPEGQPARLAGALIDVRPVLSHDRKQVTVEARLVWIGEDLNSAHLEGALRLDVGKPALVGMGTAGGRRIVAVLRPAVRFGKVFGPVGAALREEEPPLMDPPAAEKQKPAAEKDRAKLFFRRKVRAMLDRAKFDYDRKKYGEAEAIAGQVLRLEPGNAEARKMFEAARAARRKQEAQNEAEAREDIF